MINPDSLSPTVELLLRCARGDANVDAANAQRVRALLSTMLLSTLLLAMPGSAILRAEKTDRRGCR